MSFRTKSLMVTVLPQEPQAQPLATPQNIVVQCPLHSTIWTCWLYSCHAFTPICPTYTPICPNASQLCPPGTLCLAGTITDLSPIVTTTPVQQTIQFSSEESLKALQTQLAQLQDATQAQLSALQAKQAPQTVEEAEMLEKHLTDALNEVKATKESLRRSKPSK
ncbi:MAG TPA: hypothetical protein VHD90_12580 [Phototrophicaceae bacterium]|nr:hypothetical protein [Phototrophicaceae bacterium]